MIEITIPMRIFPKKRPQTVMNKTTGKRHTYTPRDAREDNLEDYFWQFVRENKLKPLTRDLRVDCIYTCQCAKRPCDKDNADKTIGDCGEGILWKNDRQIADGRSYFITSAEKDSIEITIKELKGG